MKTTKLISLKTILLLLSLAWSMMISSAFAQDACSSCQQGRRLACERSCTQRGVPRVGLASCTAQCQRESCATPCMAQQNPYRTPTGQPPITGPGTIKDKSDMSCDYCLRYMEYNVCADRCANQGDIMRCRKLCAKQECASQCQLPSREINRKENTPSPRDCNICKRTARTACSDKCGDDKERAGYTACLVSCIEDRCLRTCHPQLF